MRKLLIFKDLSQRDTGNVYIFADKIIAVRVWGEGVRIFTDNDSFDVSNTLQEVLEVVSRAI